MGQWELHPWLGRPDIVEWCQKRGVILEAYCPIVRGNRFDEPVLQPMVKKYNKTPAQILIRWSLQKVCQSRSNPNTRLHVLDAERRSGFRAASKVCDAFADQRECQSL